MVAVAITLLPPPDRFAAIFAAQTNMNRWYRTVPAGTR